MNSGNAAARVHERGFTYLAMLFAIATAGAVLASGSVVWHTEAQREREKELLRIGNEFRYAIGLYYHRSPGSVARYPEKLDDLLRDDRHLTLQRYLRRIYRDPMTGTREWGVITSPQGGIMGVYSRSDGTPVKTSGFEERDAAFSGKLRYSGWAFIYTPPGVEPASAPDAEGGVDRELLRSRRREPVKIP